MRWTSSLKGFNKINCTVALGTIVLSLGLLSACSNSASALKPSEQSDRYTTNTTTSSATVETRVNQQSTSQPPISQQSIKQAQEAQKPQTTTNRMPSPLIRRNDYQAFANMMVREHGFSRRELDTLFSQVYINQEIIAKITKPAEGIDWHRYRNIFIQPERMAAGAEFWRQHEGLLAAAQVQYGVPPEIIAGIIGVETYYGRFKGSYPVIEALATLGFDYPKRGQFFRKQLAAFLVLARDNGFDTLAVKGSYAGAMGLPQFIPTSYQAYAVDGDGDGIIDLFNNPADAIFSVANYFAEHKWRPNDHITYQVEGIDGRGWQKNANASLKPNTTVGALAQKGMTAPTWLSPSTPTSLFAYQQPNGKEYWLGLHNFYVITRYNHSHLYALAVYQLSQGILRQK